MKYLIVIYVRTTAQNCSPITGVGPVLCMCVVQQNNIHSPVCELLGVHINTQQRHCVPAPLCVFLLQTTECLRTKVVFGSIWNMFAWHYHKYLHHLTTISVKNRQFFPPTLCIYSPRWIGSHWNWVSAQGSEETRMMGLPDGRKGLKIGLAILIQYQRVMDTQPASHIAIASTVLTMSHG